MMNAAELQKTIDQKSQDAKTSEAFKYAMNRIEEELELAAKYGHSEVSYRICALTPKCDDSIDRFTLNAITEEMKKNGYRFEVFNGLDCRGYGYTGFRIIW